LRSGDNANALQTSKPADLETGDQVLKPVVRFFRDGLDTLPGKGNDIRGVMPA
jgi:hypothetical protein